MISESKYNEILSNGLIMDHYLILLSLRDKKQPFNSKRFQGFINLLQKKGLINTDYSLTEKGQLLVGKENKAETSFSAWVTQLHINCQNKLQELTGKKQVRDKIKNISYSFLPNPTDLAKSLSKVVLTYKISNFEKIEKTIMSYIEKCNNERNWFPVLQYYISKDNTSRLVTDMESEEEILEQTYKSRQKLQ